MTVKELKEIPIWKEHLEKMASGEYDDYTVLIQVDGKPGALSGLHADKRLRLIWWMGNSSLQIPEPESFINKDELDMLREETAHNIRDLKYFEKHGHWPK